ncbi:hypothetical protein ScPMuIL_015043 [Solemya velum]
MLGDQPAATIGQLCFKNGDAKCTYGTACSLDMNVGLEPLCPKTPLFSKVQYQFGQHRPVVYSLAGISEISGAAVRWLRDNLGVIKTAAEIEDLAEKVESSDGCVFVPAFEGFVYPEVSDGCRGIICGLTQSTRKEHIARATLEAVCFQTREIIEGIVEESGQKMSVLIVDGGMTANKLFLQMLADLTGTVVEHPAMQESTALGAALAAGAADEIGLFPVRSNGVEINIDFLEKDITVYRPNLSDAERNIMFDRWKMAKKKSMHSLSD